MHLVEGSPVLREAQRSLLAGHAPVFHESAASLPEDRPLLIVANEFFDALPIRQLVRTAQGWREMVVVCRAEEMDARFGPCRATARWTRRFPQRAPTRPRTR